jgi:alpha-glucuronidase
VDRLGTRISSADKAIWAATVVAISLFATPTGRAETGGRLWLRYDRVADAARLAAYRSAVTSLVIESTASPTGRVIAAELGAGLSGLLGGAVPAADAVRGDGALLIGTPRQGSAIATLGLTKEIEPLGNEGYLIRSTRVGGHRAIVIASKSDVGALYGVFQFLRLLQTGAPIAELAIAERPRLERRLLNHWDNLDGSIERGYAGRSLWWASSADSRIVDYARANASIGINGTIISSVNADPRVLTPPYLQQASSIADTLRPYGIRVYLAANAAAPRMLGELTTADPRDASVAQWWRRKADEIYARIPDFGGFVVKANSEGEPGPQDYGRTHADGANVLADALAPHGGIVMWRAFVYDEKVDPDRVKRAYLEFVPLDGRFRDNVFVQVKNGPLDFQPREPFHPLFGALPKTPIMAELQITQEYLGHSNHLVYLAPMWKEFLDADTFAAGPGSSVARVIDGSLEGKQRTGIAGVANTGSDPNWTGHDFAQANWYAYGRLAWSPALSAGAVADEWIRMTWSQAPDVVNVIRSMMLDSREAFVHYTMPLGLHHLIGGDHYAPMPENPDPRRADWSAIYYHRADASRIGFDRTRQGSGAVDQYFAPLRDRWNNPGTTPPELLLWFHRLPWDYRLASGRTIWAELVRLYTLGAEQARDLERRWMSLRGRIDGERFDAVLAKLQRQTADAAAWRDKCLAYFQGFSKRPLSEGAR